MLYLRNAHRALKREKHLYLGITRFYKANDAYIAVIKPKNRIVPLMAYHFSQRFANQNFMIYDAKKQVVNSGGSGCGCSAVVFGSYIMDRFYKKDISDILLIGTGIRELLYRPRKAR